GDARWRRPDRPIAASGVRVPLHVNCSRLPNQWKEPPPHPARITGIVLQDPLFAESPEDLKAEVTGQNRQMAQRGIGNQVSDEVADLHCVQGMPNPCVETRRPQAAVRGCDTEAAP